jgi:hypothetical protein
MRGGFINEYQKLNSEDQKTFRRWLWANTVVGAILLAGLIALALKLPGDQSGATAQHAMRAQAKLPPERTSALPSVRARDVVRRRIVSMSPGTKQWSAVTPRHRMF